MVRQQDVKFEVSLVCITRAYLRNTKRNNKGKMKPKKGVHGNCCFFVAVLGGKQRSILQDNSIRKHNLQKRPWDIALKGEEVGWHSGHPNSSEECHSGSLLWQEPPWRARRMEAWCTGTVLDGPSIFPALKASSRSTGCCSPLHLSWDIPQSPAARQTWLQLQSLWQPLPWHVCCT